jgi:hypothetical protein
VTVLISKGDGTFIAGVNYAAGPSPSNVTVGDFNGDHRLDLAVTASDGANGIVNVLLGKGDGTFQKAIPNLMETLQPYGLGQFLVADLNGDGKADVAAIGLQDSTLSIAFGNGDGTLGPATAYGSGAVALYVASGDFDGDGKLDLVTGNQGTFGVLFNGGDGTFRSNAEYLADVGPRAVVTADFNGDGIADIASANGACIDDNVEYCLPAQNISILLGNGDGTFKARANFPTGNYPQSLAVGDFNGDGHPDIVTANHDDDTVSVLLGNGDGTFRSKVDYATAPYPFSVATGDFDGDGKLDLAVATVGSNVVSVLLGNGDGWPCLGGYSCGR